MMSESQLEKYFSRKCKKHRILTKKMKFIGARGAPDRLICYQGAVYFVELKVQDGGVLSESQKATILEFNSHGINVYVLQGKDEIDWFLSRLIKNGTVDSKKPDRTKG